MFPKRQVVRYNKTSFFWPFTSTIRERTHRTAHYDEVTTNWASFPSTPWLEEFFLYENWIIASISVNSIRCMRRSTYAGPLSRIPDLIKRRVMSKSKAWYCRLPVLTDHQRRHWNTAVQRSSCSYNWINVSLYKCCSKSRDSEMEVL